MAERHAQQGFGARRNQTKPQGARDLSVGACRDGGQHFLRGERADDGLDIARREASMDLRGQRTLFLVDNRHQRGLGRQSVEDGSEGALEMGVGCGFG